MKPISNKRGRPKFEDKEKEAKTVRYTIRFTESENKQLLEAVGILNLSIADYLRKKGLGGRSSVINGKSLITSVDVIGAELGRSGNNINQLAKHANTLNLQSKLDGTTINRFNILFADYIKAQREIEIALRKIIREIND